jgi:beta-lactamase superfamily II metal-dependent hydrolase
VVFIARIKPVYQMLYASGSFRHPRSQQLHWWHAHEHRLFWRELSARCV